MISLTISILLLIFSCIAYKNDPAPARRRAIKSLTIADVPLTVIYLYFFFVILLGAMRDHNAGLGFDSGSIVLLLLLLLPISVALPAIFFGIRAINDKTLMAIGMSKAAEEENLKNTALKFCVKCHTSSPLQATECKHCKGTEFTFEAPNEVSVIPQQIRNNTPSDDEVEDK